MEPIYGLQLVGIWNDGEVSGLLRTSRAQTFLIRGELLTGHTNHDVNSALKATPSTTTDRMPWRVRGVN